jgi:hypothetical protein
MSCKIDNSKMSEWTINDIPSLFKLLSLNNEASGKFYIDTKKHETYKLTVNHGSESSVEAPEAIINYHTHPASCYISEKTVWGFPSGEDIRETILLGLNGTVAHAVVAVEGTYVCQVNPNVLRNLIDLNVPIERVDKELVALITPKGVQQAINDFYRGLIVLCIEIYFRSVHAFRTHKYVSKYSKTDVTDFVKFINNFKISNIFSEKQIEGCGQNIKCHKIWTFENKLKQMSFPKYVHDYDENKDVYMCSSTADIRNSGVKLLTAIKYKCFDAIVDINFGVSPKYKNIVKSDQWFCTRFWSHKINGTVYGSLSTNEKLRVLKDIASGSGPVITLTRTPVFKFFDILGSCDHKDIKKELNTVGSVAYGSIARRLSVRKGAPCGSGSPTGALSGLASPKTAVGKKFIYFGSEDCPYCVKFKKQALKKGLNIGTWPSPKRAHKTLTGPIDISTAIKNAKKYSKTQVSSIPAVFHNKKRIDHNILIKKMIIVYM